MKKYLIMLGIIALIAAISFPYGYYTGKANTMRSFQTRECWITEPSMDVNCTVHIGDL